MTGIASHARARNLPPVEERVDRIAREMLAGTWVSSRAVALAEEWGCAVNTVQYASAEASRLVRRGLPDRDQARALVVARLERAHAIADGEQDSRGIVASAMALAKVYGVDKPEDAQSPGDAARVVETAPALTLEWLLTVPGDIPAPSPAQLAIVRAADGLPTGLSADAEAALFGAARTPCRPDRVLVVAGVRGGKSRMAACAAVHSALTADLSQASAFEEVRVVVLAPRRALARLTFAQVTGVLRHPSMAHRVVGEPTADTVRVRRDDGREVSIVIAAASAYGTTVRSGWLAGLLLDEAAFFGDGDDGYAVNVADIVGAAETRLLGALWVITSPNGQRGWVRETWEATTGKGGEWLTVHAPTRTLNPAYPQAKIERLRASDPDAAAREFDAAWIDADHQWLPSEWIVKACAGRTADDVPRIPGGHYVATMDPAFRGNAWTITIGCVDTDGRIAVHAAREWVGSRERPLVAGDVLSEVAELCARYQIHAVHSDQASFDALHEHAQRVGLSLVEQAWGAERTAVYEAMRTAFGEGRMSLPDVPALVRDLGSVRRRLTVSGASISLPTTPDGRHCDFAPALAMLVHRLRFGASPERQQTAEEREDAEFGDGDGDERPWFR